jgi:hypothetical protein
VTEAPRGRVRSPGLSLTPPVPVALGFAAGRVGAVGWPEGDGERETRAGAPSRPQKSSSTVSCNEGRHQGTLCRLGTPSQKTHQNHMKNPTMTTESIARAKMKPTSKSP